MKPALWRMLPKYDHSEKISNYVYHECCKNPAVIRMKFVYAVFAFSQGDIVVTIMASDGDRGINDAVTYAFNSSKL